MLAGSALPRIFTDGQSLKTKTAARLQSDIYMGYPHKDARSSFLNMKKKLQRELQSPAAPLDIPLQRSGCPGPSTSNEARLRCDMKLDGGVRLATVQAGGRPHATRRTCFGAWGVIFQANRTKATPDT